MRTNSCTDAVITVIVTDLLHAAAMATKQTTLLRDAATQQEEEATIHQRGGRGGSNEPHLESLSANCQLDRAQVRAVTKSP